MPEPRRILTATADVALGEPTEMMHRLCDHFREHGSVHVEAAHSRIETDFGTASLAVRDGLLALAAESGDETGLAFVKLSLAEHLRTFAAAEAPRIVWHGDGQAGTPLPYFREMIVVSAQSLTPRMRRITLRGDDLGRFATGGHHVRLLFPKDGHVAWPATGEDGRPQWPQGAARPDVRIYTIRRIDVEAGEVDIDFVLHDGDCPGGNFAAGAVPGDVVGMTGPGGGATPDADWLLLAGDETALPAIARILEELPASATAVVRIEVAGRQEELPLSSRAFLDLQWLHRGEAAPAGTTTLLEDAVRAVALPEYGRRFVWLGCEHASFRSIRGWLRKDRKLARDEHLAVAYWRRGLRGDDARNEDQ